MDDHPLLQRFQPSLRHLLCLILVYVGLADDTAEAGRVDGAARAFAALSDPQGFARRHHRRVTALLRPLEAATRRLIVVLAASLPAPVLKKCDLQPDRPRIWRKPLAAWQMHTPGITVPHHILSPVRPNPAPRRMPRFALLDPLKRFDRKRHVRRVSCPRILSPFERMSPLPAAASRQTPDDPVPDCRVMRRVAALAHALEDLPKQARRFARWTARCNRGLTLRLSPLRPGRPPGSPSRRLPADRHGDEHVVLAELSRSALHAWAGPDTS